MLDINGTEFREIVLRAIETVLAEQQARPKQRVVYVVFEDSFDVRYDSFLQTLTERDAVTAIVPDAWSQEYRDRIRRNCPFCQIIGQAASGNLPLEGSLSVYPVVSNGLLAKAALCLDDTFQTQWLTKCYGAGSAIHFMLSGLTKFTGREPQGYVQKILSYIETALTFDISIGSYPTEHPSEPKPVAAVPVTPTARRIAISGRVITTADIAGIPSGSTVTLERGAIVTAYAAEEATQKQIQFVHSN